MNYNDYKNARDSSWKILLDNNICELPVDIIKICSDMGIKIKYYCPSDNSDGSSTIINGVPCIFVKKDCFTPRKRFTIAHELGHIVSGHIGKYILTNREPSPTDNPIEQAANVFASRLLAPACVLWGCGIRTAEEIAQLCDISYTSAEFRAARMAELYKRDKFLTSQLERQVFHQFKNYIDLINRQHQGDY